MVAIICDKRLEFFNIAFAIQIILFFFFCNCCSAAETDDGNKYCANSAFSARNGSSRLIIIGSVHMGTAEMSPVLERLARSVIKKSTILYTESGLPPGEMSKERALAYKNSKKFVDSLKNSPELYDEWATNIKLSYGLSDEIISQLPVSEIFNSIFSAYTLPQTPGGISESIRYEYGFESIVMAEASNNRVEIAAIEDVPPELFYRTLSDEQIINYSQSAYRRMSDISRDPESFYKSNKVIDMSNLFNMVAKGDIDGVSQLMEITEKSSVGDFADTIFNNSKNNRNKNMYQNILKIPKKYFFGKKYPVVVIGASHLGGEHGVVNSLRMSGYMFSCFEEE